MVLRSNSVWTWWIKVDDIVINLNFQTQNARRDTSPHRSCM